jgi:hypothetical protein
MVHVGQKVIYVLDGEFRTQGEVRPAFVVRVWNDEVVNLVVLLDGSNDRFPFVSPSGIDERFFVTFWKTSVAHSENAEPGTWHHDAED